MDRVLPLQGKSREFESHYLHNMKKIVIASLLSLFLLSFSIVGNSPVRTVENRAYKAGEVLNYRIHYGVISAGVVSMEVGTKVIDGKTTYHLKVEGETLKSFDWAYKVRDKFESWIDITSQLPIRYSKVVRENKYFDEDIAIYNHSEKWLRNPKGKLNITQYTQDLPSAIYYLRTIDYSKDVVGSQHYFDVYLDNKVYKLSLKYDGKETLKTDIGTIKCIKLKPQLIVDRVFKESDAMTIWVSDDENKIPIRISSEIYVGSIKVDITKTQNLKNPMTSQIK